MKVAVIGGGSFSTPALFQGMRGEFAGCEFVLAARSDQHLPAVARASRVLAGERGPQITPVVCDAESGAAVLRGADVVIIQARIGNMAARSLDESFPLRFDLCGDEGLGPGGVSAAWRSWPAIARWLEAIRQHAPRALVMMMSSPVGILTRAANMEFAELNCVGVCEVPYVALREMSALLHADLASMTFGYLGVNHIGWLYAVEAAGRDLVGEWARRADRKDFAATDLIMHWGGIPTKYLRLHFQPGAVIAAQRSALIPRSIALERLQQSTLPLYSTADAAELRQLIGQRDTPWYSDAIVPILKGLREGDARGPFFLSGPNRGYFDAFDDDEILEIPCHIRNGAIGRIHSRAPPPRITAMISEFCRHERLATTAVLSRRESALQNALAAHPWIMRTDQQRARHRAADLAADLAHVIVTENRRYEGLQAGARLQ